MHTHLDRGPQHPRLSRARRVRHSRRALRSARGTVTLEAGFTTVRNVGAGGYGDVALRDAIDANEIPGPRMRVSGYALGIKGGHLRQQPAGLGLRFHRQERRRRTLGRAHQGARNGEIRRRPDQDLRLRRRVVQGRFPPARSSIRWRKCRPIVAEAHKLGRKVAAHAHGASSIRDAITAGVDSIEHASLIDDEGIRLAREHGTYLVMDHLQRRLHFAGGRKGGHAAGVHRKGARTGPAAARQLPARAGGRRQDGVRHRFRRVPPRRQRQTVFLHDQVRHDADAGDQGRHHQRRRPPGLETTASVQSRPASSPISSQSTATRRRTRPCSRT